MSDRKLVRQIREETDQVRKDLASMRARLQYIKDSYRELEQLYAGLSR